MKSFVALALAASALAMPSPQSNAPQGCQSSRDGTFQISVVNVTKSAKRSVEKRQLDGILSLTLKGGVLTDQAGRTGSVVANHQFQFDQPPQADALKTSGFSVCGNGSLALDSSAIWYQCLSGTFYNLYDQSQGGQCSPIYLVASGAGPVSQISDGQPAASTAIPVTQVTDGQPQATTGVVSQIADGQAQAPTGVVSQIADGQPQAPTGVVSQIADGQPQAPTGVVSQIADGQPQAPTGVVSQIADGQPQAPTGVVSQIADGQPQAPTGAAPVTQISDGQLQAPTAAPEGPVISQISDGQPQVPAATSAAAAPPVTQISDGQPQAPVASGNLTSPNATAPPQTEFTGAASTPLVGVGAFAAGLFAIVAML